MQRIISTVLRIHEIGCDESVTEKKPFSFVDDLVHGASPHTGLGQFDCFCRLRHRRHVRSLLNSRSCVRESATLSRLGPRAQRFCNCGV